MSQSSWLVTGIGAQNRTATKQPSKRFHQQPLSPQNTGELPDVARNVLGRNLVIP
jgi:hypothetical protein